MKFKLFSFCDEVTLHEKVNKFLSDPLIEVASAHFSTAMSVEEMDGGHAVANVRYSVAIFYRDRSDLLSDDSDLVGPDEFQIDDPMF